LRGNPQVSPAAASQGLDLSGPIHGAGGIAGLLAAYGTNLTTQTADDKQFWYFYDAEPLTRRTTRSVGAAGPRAKPARRVKGNGNVGQLVKTVKDGQGNITGVENTLAAHYEYDPYGNLIHSNGPYADANPFRFSTKWFDAETGLGYWGYRYYSPRVGRWMSRDPIGEEGGLNMHAFVNNAPPYLYDPVGLIGGLSTAACRKCCGDAYNKCRENGDSLADCDHLWRGCHYACENYGNPGSEALRLCTGYVPPLATIPWYLGGCCKAADVLECMGRCLAANHVAEQAVAAGIIGQLPVSRNICGLQLLPGPDPTAPARIVNLVTCAPLYRCGVSGGAVTSVMKAGRGVPGAIITTGGVAITWEGYCLVRCSQNLKAY